MTFKPESVETFIRVFRESKATIASYEGCLSVELLQDVKHPNIFFTKSIWKDAEHLEHYRNSSFFKQTWSKTKVHFSENAVAWSLNVVE